MSRIRSLDLARGFTVLFIPAIHTGVLYSDLSVHQSYIGKFLIVIAEGPGGQLLMLLMGISFILKGEQTVRSIIKRSAMLLLAGYILNVLKFVAPYCAGLLPTPVSQELEINPAKSVITQLAGIGDILHFAALAQLVLFGIHKLKNPHWIALGSATLIAILSPLFWDRQPDIPVINYLTGLATGHPPQVFFPLLPWLIYPLVGYCIGFYLKRNQKLTMEHCAIIGFVLVMEGIIEQFSMTINNPYGFYRTIFPETCWHLGIVLIVLSAWYWISKNCKDNLFFQLLTYSSKNITLLYFVQWIMICWLLPVVGFRQLDLKYSVVMMIIMTLNTYALVYISQHIKNRYAK